MSPPLSSSSRPSSWFNRDVVAGALFLAIGLFFPAERPWPLLRHHAQDRAGAFPSMVAGLLILTGVGLCVKGLITRGPVASVFGAPRPLLAVLASLILFGVTVRDAGLLPAVLLCTLAAALAMRPLRPGGDDTLRHPSRHLLLRRLHHRARHAHAGHRSLVPLLKRHRPPSGAFPLDTLSSILLGLNQAIPAREPVLVLHRRASGHVGGLAARPRPGPPRSPSSCLSPWGWTRSPR